MSDESSENQKTLITRIIVDAVRDALDKGLTQDVAIDAALETFRRLLPRMALRLTRSLHESKNDLLQGLQRDRQDIADAVEQYFGTALGNYEATCHLGFEIGRMCHELYGDDAIEKSRSDLTCDVVFPLHARACTVATEVLHLFRGGFADGATARQRTLHEITVTIDVLVMHHMSGVVEQYVDYAVVEQYKDVKAFQASATALGQVPLSDAEVLAIKTKYDEVIAGRGRNFVKANQWAAPAFASPPNSIQFHDLEVLAGVGHRRPFYRLGNHQVHAGPRAAMFNVRSLNSHESLIAVGPIADEDIAEVAHQALISLYHSTAVLATYVGQVCDQYNADSIVALECMKLFVEHSGQSLLRASRRL